MFALLQAMAPRVSLENPVDVDKSQNTQLKEGSFSHMKFICPKSELLNGLQVVSKAVPAKTTMTILECILVDCTQGCIKLTANDMELGIETIVEGTIAEPGVIALHANSFLEFVRR